MGGEKAQDAVHFSSCVAGELPVLSSSGRHQGKELSVWPNTNLVVKSPAVVRSIKPDKAYSHGTGFEARVKTPINTVCPFVVILRTSGKCSSFNQFRVVKLILSQYSVFRAAELLPELIKRINPVEEKDAANGTMTQW